MSPILIVHIAAGCTAIITGSGAMVARKGAPLHRTLGRTFALSMIVMAALGLWLAALLPQMASAAVGILAAYLCATGWASLRRMQIDPGMFEIAAFLVAAGVGGALFLMGLGAASSPSDALQGSPASPYWLFAAFAGFAAALDLKVILAGSQTARGALARHLWRMGTALFFASSFFFLGQQRAMPAVVRGSPLLFVPAFAPLVVIALWLVRVRLGSWARRTTARISKPAPPSHRAWTRPVRIRETAVDSRTSTSPR